MDLGCVVLQQERRNLVVELASEFRSLEQQLVRLRSGSVDFHGDVRRGGRDGDRAIVLVITLKLLVAPGQRVDEAGFGLPPGNAVVSVGGGAM